MTLQMEHPPIEETSEAAEPTIYRLSVEQYEAMIRLGILTEDDKVELLEGVIVNKMTKNQPHVTCVGLMNHLFTRLLSDGWFVNVEQPAQIASSLPEPDITVIRGKHRDYTNRRVPADQIGLLIEVSDTTLSFDRTTKLQAYGRGGVPVYWIVNLNERQIEVFTEPFADEKTAGYKKREVFTEANQIAVVLDGQEITRIPVSDLLP